MINPSGWISCGAGIVPASPLRAGFPPAQTLSSQPVPKSLGSPPGGPTRSFRQSWSPWARYEPVDLRILIKPLPPILHLVASGSQEPSTRALAIDQLQQDPRPHLEPVENRYRARSGAEDPEGLPIAKKLAPQSNGSSPF